MLKKLIPLALLPIFAFAQPAEARRLFWWELNGHEQQVIPAPPYQESFGGPDDQDLYDGPDDRFNERQFQIYRRDMQRRYGDEADLGPEDSIYGPPPTRFARPVPVVPYADSTQPRQQVKPRKIAKAKPKLAPPQLATTTHQPIPVTPKQVTTTLPKKTSGPITCEKGASIVSGFGFDDVKTKKCEPGTLAYNAQRSGKPFEIDVNPKTGELIAVKKLAVTERTEL